MNSTKAKRGDAPLQGNYRLKTLADVFFGSLVIIFTSLILNVAGSSGVHAALGPVVTGTSVNWTADNKWEGELILSALEISKEDLALLANYAYYVADGHKHYQDETSTTPSVNGDTIVNLSGSVDYGLNDINQRVFGTRKPTLGQSVIIKTRHEGRGYVADSPECVGSFLYTNRSNFNTARGWPYECMTTPPPNQSCSVDLPDGSFVDLGNVPVDSIQTARFRIATYCTESGGISFFPGVGFVTGTGQGAIISTGIVDDGQFNQMPYRVELRGGEKKTNYLDINIQYNGVGATEANISIIWSPS